MFQDFFYLKLLNMKLQSLFTILALSLLTAATTWAQEGDRFINDDGIIIGDPISVPAPITCDGKKVKIFLDFVGQSATGSNKAEARADLGSKVPAIAGAQGFSCADCSTGSCSITFDSWTRSSGNPPMEQVGDTDTWVFDSTDDSFAAHVRCICDNPANQQAIDVNRLTQNQPGSITDAAIFPNPAQDRVSLKFHATAAPNNFSVWVSDIRGQRLFEQKPNVELGWNQLDLNVTDLQEGVYWIQVMQGDEAIHTQQVMIAR